jgi:hypothetical protein
LVVVIVQQHLECAVVLLRSSPNRRVGKGGELEGRSGRRRREGGWQGTLLWC